MGGERVSCWWTWHREGRDHVCECSKSVSHEGRHVCRCRSWWEPRKNPPEQACPHRRWRLLSNAGESYCEMCERLKQNWIRCDLCGEMVPPGGCSHETHPKKKTVACPECKGRGDRECDELDCHGEYCDEGTVYCDECDGSGKVVINVA